MFIIVAPIPFTPCNCFGSVILFGKSMMDSAACRYAFARKGSPCRIIISFNSDRIFTNSSFKRSWFLPWVRVGDAILIFNGSIIFNLNFLFLIVVLDGETDFNFVFLIVFLQYPYLTKVRLFEFIFVAQIGPLSVSKHLS